MILDFSARAKPVFLSAEQSFPVATVNPKKAPFLQSGLGLVELMVAMVIGIIGVLVMMQMFAVSEEQKRTTVSGSDSLTSGAIALATLQRDIQQSGWGISSKESIGCSITGLLNGGTAVPLAPVRINPTGKPTDITDKDDDTDVIQIVSGSGNGTVEGALIGSVDDGNKTYEVQGSEAFSVGEMVFAAPEARSSTCSLSATQVSSAAARPNVNVTATVAGMKGGRLFSLGVAPAIRVYRVKDRTLSVCNYVADDCKEDTKWQPIAENIVSMRAVYLPSETQTSPTCGWAEIPAIRLVLVARSSQPEKNPDWPNHTKHVWGGAAPTWAGSGVAAISLPSPDSTWPTWQDFRYKVFETVIPLRNVIAAGGVKECT